MTDHTDVPPGTPVHALYLIAEALGRMADALEDDPTTLARMGKDHER